MEVKVYSTPTCPYCVMAKKYFKKEKVDFQDFDVSKDKEKAQEMIDISGQMGVPVIVIDDNIIVGFDQEQIEKLIKK